MIPKKNAGIYSPWSTPVHNTTVRGITTESLRKMWIEDEIQCVCIEFDYWGTTKTLQIPFAKYRPTGRLAFGTYGTDVPELDNFKIGEQIELPSTGIYQDSTLQDTLSIYKTDKTGRENCDIWMQYKDQYDTYSTPIYGVPAVEYCRNLNISSKAPKGYFDLPNVYELSVIYIEANNIDKLDPTAESYPNNKLGTTNPNATSSRRFYNGGALAQWTSTEYSSVGVLCINSTGSVYDYHNKTISYGVVPCRVI